ncbi:hypothetical protein NEIRO02_1521 [Nematocida sp. AWRm79]|nr:hypothetical protein NEIRO02_1521 [Nematocida sp. AWRm79]
MENNMIIKLLIMMYTVCARLEISDINTLGETVVIQESNLLIHPDGPLSPIRGYIMYKSGYMYNKRFYSPEINIEYSLKKSTKVSDDGNPIYDYIRKPVNDEVYDDICENTEYLTQLHTQLIKLFPSPDGSLSIVSGRKDAMHSFLIKDEVQSHSMYILATILLLSEQVNIPINTSINGEKWLLLRSANKTTTYINQKKPNNYLLNLIEFLKKYINNSSANPNSIEKLSTMPTKYEQFITGEFLNTPQFFIQSYIYEFIDTPEKYIEFIEAVYTLLNDQIKSEKSTLENKAKSSQVFEMCFIEKTAISDLTNHANVIFDLKQTIDNYRKCPFIDETELPAYTRVKAYDRINGKEINDESQKYSNCVEAGILGLACCLMYDPVEKRYNTDHLPDNEETKPLKDFFQNYPKPTETTSQEMSQEWCRVVADLKNSKISYVKKENNELKSSLLNILYVISDITGNKEEVLNEIEKIKRICSDKEANPWINVQKSLNIIFKALSKNKNVEVKSDEFIVDVHINEVPGVFGRFSILYSFKDIKSGITIGINPLHTKLHLSGSSLSNDDKAIIKGKLTKIHNMYNNSNNYTKCIIRHYINIELIKIEQPYIFASMSVGNEILDNINNGGYNNVLKLFLYGSIETIYYKEYIIKYFLIFYVNPIKNDNSLTRMTNNIIGSIPLCDLQTRKYTLTSYLFNYKAKNFYKKIEESIWDNIHISNSDELSSIMLYPNLVIPRIRDDFLYFIINLMNNLNNQNNSYDILINYHSMIKNVLDYLNYTTKPKITAFYTIMNNIKESLKEMNIEKVTNIYLSWFFDILTYDNTPEKDNYLLYLFNIIDNKYLILENIQWSIKDNSILLNYLAHNKNKLCSNIPERIQKYNNIIQILNNIGS